MSLVGVLAVLGLVETRVPRRLELDHDGLLPLRLGPSPDGIDTNAVDANLVLSEDVVECVERLGTVDVKVEDVSEGLLEGVVGEALHVADEGEKLSEREGVGERSSLR